MATSVSPRPPCWWTRLQHLWMKSPLTSCSGQMRWTRRLSFSHSCIQPLSKWLCLWVQSTSRFWPVVTTPTAVLCPHLHHPLTGHFCGPTCFSASTPAWPQVLNTESEPSPQNGDQTASLLWTPSEIPNLNRGKTKVLRLTEKVLTWPALLPASPYPPHLLQACAVLVFSAEHTSCLRALTPAVLSTWCAPLPIYVCISV